MHLSCTNLNFKGNTPASDYSCVQGLVTVRFRHGNIVFESSRHGFIKFMYQTQNRITVTHCRDYHPRCENIINLIYVFLLRLHFAVDAVKMLRTAFNIRLNTHLKNTIAQLCDNFHQVFFPVSATLCNITHQFIVGVRIQISETEIFQFPFNFINTQTMR